jgi:hypothetical protein
MGILNGVSFTQTASLAFPLTPKFVVSLSSKHKDTKYLMLDDYQVNNANSKQIQHCLEYYYALPKNVQI